jgi:hypothetical protein
MPSKTVFHRPDRLQVTGGMQSISCDGERLQVVLDALRQYTLVTAPEALAFEHVRMGAPGGGFDDGYPEILRFLLGGEDLLERWLATIARIQLVPSDPPVAIEGEDVHVVKYRTSHMADVTLYISAGSKLLLRCDIDATHAQRPAGQSPGAGEAPPPQLEVALELHPLTVDGPIPDQVFAVSEPEGMRRVAEFANQPPGGSGVPDPAAPGDAAHPLEGEALPPVAGSDLDGMPVGAQTLAGKVVLVFFWTAAGDPASLAAIQVAARIADRFGESAGFSLLSIAAGGSDSKVVRDLLEAKKAPVRTIVDSDGRLAAAFSISELPAFFLADAGGTVTRAVLAQPPPAAEAELIEAIDLLLAPPKPSDAPELITAPR